jgi:hypothetical protein
VARACHIELIAQLVGDGTLNLLGSILVIAKTHWKWLVSE